jgi:hypothetical protein
MAGPVMPPTRESPVWPFHATEQGKVMGAQSSGFGLVTTADQSHRQAITGRDCGNGNRTVILWRETDLVNGRVERQVVITLDATLRTAVILTLPQAAELADALSAAAAIR